MDTFNYIEKEFRKRAFIASSYPYEDICDNYYDYMRKINMVDDKDPIKKSLLTIKQHLQNGLTYCCVWDKSKINKHFVSVYNVIQGLKQQ